MDFLIGIDIGTSSIKAGLYDNNCSLIANASGEVKLLHAESGSVEQDPMSFYTICCALIKSLLTKSGVENASIKSLSIDGQMAGILGVDEDMNPVTPYDSWLDVRCKKYVDYLKDNFEEKIISLSGLPATVAHCAKILWWKNERPNIYKNIKKFIQPAAFVTCKLIGLKAVDAFIDYTYLHFTGLYDSATTQWSKSLCSELSIPIEKLPKIVKPWETVGSLSKAAAEECGLKAGTPIAAGAGDQAAGFLGAGVVEPGDIIDVAGTASVFACCVDSFKPDLKFKTLVFPKGVSNGLWYPHAYIAGGGLCLNWFVENFMQKQIKVEAFNSLNIMAQKIPPGSDGLYFIPHLGGRTYPYDSNMKGSWIGLKWGHTAGHMYRAILESIAYEYYIYLTIEKELFPDIQFDRVRVIGGGAESSVFNRIKSDVLGIPYVTINRKETATLGSAIIAGHSVGVFTNMEETARRITSIESEIKPNLENHILYKELAESYRSLLGILSKFYNREYGPEQNFNKSKIGDSL